MKDLKPRKRDSFHLTAIFSSFPWCLNRQISFKSKRLRVMPMLCPWKAWGHCICEEVSFGGQETWFRNHGHTRDTSDTVFVPWKCTCWTPVPHCDYAWRWSLYRELQGGSLGWDWPLLRPSKKRRRHHCVCPARSTPWGPTQEQPVPPTPWSRTSHYNTLRNKCLFLRPGGTLLWQP